MFLYNYFTLHSWRQIEVLHYGNAWLADFPACAPGIAARDGRGVGCFTSKPDVTAQATINAKSGNRQRTYDDVKR